MYVFDFCDGKNIIQYMSCQQKLLDVTTRSKDNKKYKVGYECLLKIVNKYFNDGLSIETYIYFICLFYL